MPHEAEDLATAARAALTKSKVLWISLADQRPLPVWYTGTGETAFVVGGPGEQAVPDLPARIEVTLLDKESRSGIGPMPAAAVLLEPDSPEWEAAATALLAARQNTTEPGERKDLWARECRVWSLEIPPRTPVPEPEPEPVPEPESEPAEPSTAGGPDPAEPTPPAAPGPRGEEPARSQDG